MLVKQNFSFAAEFFILSVFLPTKSMDFFVFFLLCFVCKNVSFLI